MKMEPAGGQTPAGRQQFRLGQDLLSGCPCNRTLHSVHNRHRSSRPIEELARMRSLDDEELGRIGRAFEWIVKVALNVRRLWRRSAIQNNLPTRKRTPRRSKSRKKKSRGPKARKTRRL